MRALSLAAWLLMAAAPAFAAPVVAPEDLSPADTVHPVIDNHPAVAAASARVGAARAHETICLLYTSRCV